MKKIFFVIAVARREGEGSSTKMVLISGVRPRRPGLVPDSVACVEIPNLTDIVFIPLYVAYRQSV